MSWIEMLYKAYENNSDKIGRKSDEKPLLPIFHTTKKRAHVEIVLDQNGKFKRAFVIPGKDAKTILPSTEKSLGRTCNCAPHPLVDQLRYIAVEYKQYGGKKKHYFNGFWKNKIEYIEGYKDVLKSWVESGLANQKVKSVYRYISKGTLISDLINAKILHEDANRNLLSSWKGKRGDKPKIFATLGQGEKQTDILVRWSVDVPNDPSSELQYDKTVWESWIDYYLSTRSQKSFCYITGRYGIQPELYPRMIRSDNDGAKLISSNDDKGFTYRGRLIHKHQVCGVDVEITHKAHNALRWLIARQGKVFFVKNGSKFEPKLSIVAWSASGIDIPNPLVDSDDLLNDTPMVQSIDKADRITQGFTAQNFGIKLSKSISGYSANIGNTDQIIVMGVDSATTGRMAITYYRELTGSDFLKRIKSWHMQSAWHQRFFKMHLNEGGRKQRKLVEFFGAPAPKDIAQAAYGIKDGDAIRLDDHLKKSTVERLIPCIIDAAQLPWDIVDSCIKKATQRQSLPDWAWQKTLGIACGLYRYYFKDTEGYKMGLDRDRKTRDYLYGRLLAVADCIESWALDDANEKRPTNASRLMQRFADYPFQTWRSITLSLSPYKARMGSRIKKHLAAEEEIMNLFDIDAFTQNEPLSGEFLLGFHCQRSELLKSTIELEKEIKNESD